MNLNDETIRKIMAETVSHRLDEMILSTFMGNIRISPGGVEWVSFKRGESRGTYTETAPEMEATPGFTWRTEYVADYTIPADSLVIEGECREVGLRELPADAVAIEATSPGGTGKAL